MPEWWLNKTDKVQAKYEDLSETLIKCLIATRLFILQVVLETNPNLKYFDWLCIQRSRRSQIIFREIYSRVTKLEYSTLHDFYSKLIEKRHCVLMFDESQTLFDVLKYDYRSTKDHQKSIKNNGFFEHPRSFFFLFD